MVTPSASAARRRREWDPTDSMHIRARMGNPLASSPCCQRGRPTRYFVRKVNLAGISADVTGVSPIGVLGGVVPRARAWLPKGQFLPEDVWRSRHRCLSLLLYAHVAGVLIYALVSRFSLVHAIAEAGLVGIFAVLGGSQRFGRRANSALVAVGLVTASAVLVHLSGGVIELHFHFFVMVAVLTLYQDWLPFLCAIGFVVLHHGVMGTVVPEHVYNHPDAVAHPFKWALIHGGFVLAASAASVVAWRLNEQQALKDSLTGLPNRRLFQDRVSHALARTQRNPTTVAVLFVDIDGFKKVNDTLGHAAGDQVLVAVADRLRGVLQPVDTPARFGGDEFAVLLEDISDAARAADVAERLLDALAVPFMIRGRDTNVGASIGIAVAERGVSAEDLLRNADVAMYTAKDNGRGRYEPFEPGMHESIVRRVELEHDLRRAVGRGELELHYQPVVSLATGRLAGLEALVRWNHPEQGLLAPCEFLGLAEETGAIVDIGDWVLREACRQARDWKDRFDGYPFTLAVNVSPRQLLEANLIEQVADSLSQSGLAARDLVVELTESVMVSDTQFVVQRLHELKDLGIQLAMDDFGTGYSSLSYLRHLPFDILKIDKLFVDGLDDVTAGPAGSAFAVAIIKMAQSAKLEIVAEGVETVGQATVLRDLGCEMAQGFYFAKPLTADAVAALLGATGRRGWNQASLALQPLPIAPTLTTTTASEQ